MHIIFLLYSLPGTSACRPREENAPYRAAAARTPPAQPARREACRQAAHHHCDNQEQQQPEEEAEKDGPDGKHGIHNAVAEGPRTFSYRECSRSHDPACHSTVHGSGVVIRRGGEPRHILLHSQIHLADGLAPPRAPLLPRSMLVGLFSSLIGLVIGSFGMHTCCTQLASPPPSSLYVTMSAWHEGRQRVGRTTIAHTKLIVLVDDGEVSVSSIRRFLRCPRTAA